MSATTSPGTIHNGETLLKEYYATKDPVLREKAVKEFLPLVYYVVNRVTLPVTDAITREDLEQSAIHGLLEAIDRFDEDRKVKFKTFAYKRIYGAVIDAIRQVRIVSRTKLERLMKVQKISENLAQKLHRDPTAEEICEEAKISMNEYSNLLVAGQLSYATFSLEDPVSSDQEEASRHVDLLADTAAEDPEKVFMMENLKVRLVNLLKELPERERLILALYYYENLTLVEIGQVLNISESRVSQIMSKSLDALRSKIQ
ncbi:MAG: FliA/WhiG family RNA polymerase sigma factor [Candidatus Marinimicrobia bacterium]|nr:FliA/WhiG family RNA polymerase sigma factor [Candidatus Neomarinimicrobiota bacterium]